jgi:hypothetical protein
MTTRGKQPSPTDLAYIAGFVDGEGTIGIYRKYDLRADWAPGYAERIIIVQVDRRPLDFIKQFFPRGSLSKKKKYHEHYRQAYALKYSHTQAYELAKALLPYLQVKRAQAEALIEFRGQMKYVDRKTSRRLDPAELKRREQYFIKLKELNGVQPQRLNPETPKGEVIV